MAECDLTAQRAHELFHYDAESGVLYRRSSSGLCKTGVPTGKGYLRVVADGRQFRAHRVAWLLHYGQWPVSILDHINRVRDDNRIENLREISDAENRQNQDGPRKSNKLGVRGVFFNRRRGLYQSRIMVKGKLLPLGFFASVDEASAVYEAARRSYHPFFNPCHTTD